MEQLSGYEIAQKRIEGRQRQRSLFGIWIGLLILSALLFLLGGTMVAGCTVPMLVIFGFLAVMEGIQLYFASPRRAPSPAMVTDEMGWLFGDDWRDMAGTQEFMLAQERIRRRRIRQGYFYLDMVVFLLVNAIFWYFAIDSLANKVSTFSGAMGCLVLFAFGWLTFLAGHGIMVFPSRRRLVRQERKIGQAILAELQSSVPEIEKRKEKPKDDIQYRVGEDGELVEIEDEFTFDDDEKPKRDTL
jgi:hypothetical protein